MVFYGPGLQRLNMFPLTPTSFPPPLSVLRFLQSREPYPPTARPRAAPQRPRMLWDSSYHPPSHPTSRSLSSWLSAHLLVPQLCHLPQQTVVHLFLSPPTGWLSPWGQADLHWGASSSSPAHRHLHILRWLWWGGVLTGDELAGLGATEH